MICRQDRGNGPFAETLSLLYLTVMKKDKGGNECESDSLDSKGITSHSN